jgi:hypothetical protein
MCRTDNFDLCHLTPVFHNYLFFTFIKNEVQQWLYHGHVPVTSGGFIAFPETGLPFR